MKLKPFTLLLILIPLIGACTEAEWQQVGQQVLTQMNTAEQNSGGLSLQEIDAGLKEALV